MKKEAHPDLDGEQYTARQRQRNVHRDSTELANRFDVNSASDSLQGKGIRRGTRKSLSEGQKSICQSVVHPSAL